MKNKIANIKTIDILSNKNNQLKNTIEHKEAITYWRAKENTQLIENTTHTHNDNNNNILFLLTLLLPQAQVCKVQTPIQPPFIWKPKIQTKAITTTHTHTHSPSKKYSITAHSAIHKTPIFQAQTKSYSSSHQNN